jgi:hypothetical protein
MKKGFTTPLFFILGLLVFCASPSEQFRKDYPALYQQYMGKWIVFTLDENCTIVGNFELNPDSSISDPHGYVLGKISQIQDFEIWWSAKGMSGFEVWGKNKKTGAVSLLKSERIDSDDLDKNNPVFVDISGIIGVTPKQNLEPVYYLTNRQGLYERIQNTNKNLITDRRLWEKVNKNSITHLVTFIKNTQIESSKKEATIMLHSLLDAKIKSYLKKTYPQYSSYCDKDIIFEDGSKICRFYEFFKMGVCGINKNSGQKIEFRITKDSDSQNTFKVSTSGNNTTATIIFKSYKENIVAMGMDVNGDTRGWQYGLSFLAGSYNAYPDLESIDTDFLEKM